MNQKEFDQLFFKILKEANALFADYIEYEKKINDKEAKSSIEYYEHLIASNNLVCSKISLTDELVQFDEDVITDIFESIAAYADAFVVRATEPERTQDLEKYKRVNELLNLFCDVDEEYEDNELEDETREQ